MLFITIILFLNKDDGRKFMKFFDKNLGQPLPERSYAEHCEVFQSTYPFINLEYFLDSIDFYLTAHLIGWYVKMLIVRDVKICWFLSILFEILEITFRHWLPNFYECWWDHAILDVFGMNALGIWLGSITCNYFEMKSYNWITKIEKPNEKRKMVNSIYNFVTYFTPNYYVKHEWDIFSSTKRFYQVIYFFIFCNLVDLSHFFIKFVIWLPANHDLLLVRILIWAFLAIISAREYYEYITNPTCKRLGFNVWLAHLVLFIEWNITLKYSTGMFTAAFPWYVKYFWTCVFVILTGITIHLVKKDMTKYFKGIKGIKYDLTEPEIEIEYVENKKTK
jgi:phosphatidylserine synthase 2